jgi:hypothetical protein
VSTVYCPVHPPLPSEQQQVRMKPKLLGDVLRQTSPRKFYGNKFAVLRDASPAESVRSNFSGRSRSFSVKRKNPQEEPSGSQASYANVASGTVIDIPVPDPDEEKIDAGIAKVRSLCDKANADLQDESLPPLVVTIFATLSEAVLGICDNQQLLKDKKFGTFVPVPGNANRSTEHYVSSQGNVSKKSRNDSKGCEYVDLATLRVPSQSNNQNRRIVPDPEPDPEKTRFREAISEAEKSTLLFNLDLGKVPLINQDAISTKVTKALTEMAAAADKCKGKIPTDDTVSALDDVLSVVEGMKFFGKTTRSFRSDVNPNSGAYCTLPVRYDFADKDTRIFAETVLRDKCKVKCATPYPAIVRECVKQIVDQVKNKYPNTFVKVNIDTHNMCFRVYRRPMVDKNYKGKKDWVRFDDTIPIPPEALNISARKAPDNFKLPGISTLLGEDIDSMITGTPPPNGGKSPRKE